MPPPSGTSPRVPSYPVSDDAYFSHLGDVSHPETPAWEKRLDNAVHRLWRLKGFRILRPLLLVVMNFSAMRHHLRWQQGPRDLLENRYHGLPADELISMPALWLTEVFLPADAQALARALPKQSLSSGSVDPKSWLAGVRGSDSPGAWTRISEYYGNGDTGFFPGNEKAKDLPAAFSNVSIYLVSVSPSITALVARMRCTEDHAKTFDKVLRQHRSTKVKKTRYGYSNYPPQRVREQAVADWLEQSATQGQQWLQQRYQGVFSRTKSGWPAVYFIISRRTSFSPATLVDRFRFPHRWMDLLRIDPHGAMTFARHPALVAFFDRWPREKRTRRDSLMVATDAQTFFADAEEARGREVTATLRSATHLVADQMWPLASQLAVGSWLRTTRDRAGELRDAAARMAASRMTGRRVDKMRAQLLRQGLDIELIADELRRSMTSGIYAFGLEGMTGYDRAGSPQPHQPDTLFRDMHLSLIDNLDHRYAAVKKLLVADAQLAVAGAGLRLQTASFWIAFISLLLALVAAAAAMAAFFPQETRDLLGRLWQR